MNENSNSFAENIFKDFENLKSDLEKLSEISVNNSANFKATWDFIFDCFLNFEDAYFVFRSSVSDLLLAMNSKKSCVPDRLKENFFKHLHCKIERINEGIIKIKMPPLLHKKVFQKIKIEDSYIENYYTHQLIIEDLKLCIEQFMQENSLEPYEEKCVMIVLNVCSKAVIPDTDNHEYQQLVNTISSTFCRDDSPDYLSFYADSVHGKEDKTVVFIAPISKANDTIKNEIIKERS